MQDDIENFHDNQDDRKKEENRDSEMNQGKEKRTRNLKDGVSQGRSSLLSPALITAFYPNCCL
jgi:hypothetical protein